MPACRMAWLAVEPPRIRGLRSDQKAILPALGGEPAQAVVEAEVFRQADRLVVPFAWSILPLGGVRQAAGSTRSGRVVQRACPASHPEQPSRWHREIDHLLVADPLPLEQMNATGFIYVFARTHLPHQLGNLLVQVLVLVRSLFAEEDKVGIHSPVREESRARREPAWQATIRRSRQSVPG